MLLADWNIELRREPLSGKLDEIAAAGVSSIGGRRLGRIWLRRDFDDFTRAEQRHFIVHELIHCHLAPLRYYMDRQHCQQTEEVQSVLRAAHTSHEEYAVDDLARIIAPHMPLPPKVKP